MMYISEWTHEFNPKSTVSSNPTHALITQLIIVHSFEMSDFFLNK
jgi:hypothetical protein